jgi:hypothetical protein
MRSLNRPGWLLPTFGALLWASMASAGPVSFDLQLNVPPVIADSQAPAGCTVTYLIADIANNDLFAARMRVASDESDIVIGNRLPCPADVPPRLGLRALDTCTNRAGDAKSCAFADMSRGFENEPDIHNTSENAARCSSDKFSDIAAACWTSGKLSVCDVGCGNSPREAVSKARARCEEKQQRSCPVTATVPVSGP